MILLGLDSILLLYITAGCGICMLGVLQKIFRQPVYANTLAVILAGLIFSTIYFNLISFWLPVNYVSLVPLFVLSSFIFWHNGPLAAGFVTAVKKQVKFVFTKRNVWVSVPVFIMLLYYWLMPPVNADSAGYHYATILWFEKYKVVPGLANVDGRLAYDAAAFIIQAAYSFTGLVGQSLYPLNGVLTALFFFWITTKILRSKNIFNGLVYFCLLYLLNRVLLVNISSPTADTLVIICLAYAFIKLLDCMLAKSATIQFVLLPAVIILYAVIAKLSAYPALLLLPVILWFITGGQKMLPFMMKLFLVSLPIYIPWLCRNVILSGYLLYPVPYIDIFTVDWKAPKSVLLLDYIYIKRLPINFDDRAVAITPPAFPHWIMPWIAKQFNESMRTNLSIFLLAVLSPLYWLTGRLRHVKIDKTPFMFWLVIYAGVFIWLVNVPEYRFGIIFLSFATLLPLLYATARPIRVYAANIAIITILFIAECAYYVYSAPGWHNYSETSVSQLMMYPPKDIQYYTKNNTADFDYTLLSNSVKLYHQDSAHLCINANLPCMTWKYGTIEMRGAGLADGFRNVQDDVQKNYPFVK